MRLIVLRKKRIALLCKTQIYQRNINKSPPERSHFVHISERLFERKWMPTEINLQLNSCQAKDKPPRPLRSERSRKADGTASSRIACQESTLWQCDT